MFYEQTKAALAVPRQPTFDELEEWSGAFYAVDESYLALVAHATASLEPWKAYLDLANKLANDKPYSFYDTIPELRRAYDYLEAARRNLRTVSYMYCRQTLGVEDTAKLFGKQDLPDRLLSVMFSA